jgi:hypothetical protein
MVEEMKLMLLLIFVRNAKSAQWSETGIDAVDRARLSGEGFDQFPAALHERPGLPGEGAIPLKHGDLPDFVDRKFMAIELGQFTFQRANFL